VISNYIILFVIYSLHGCLIVHEKLNSYGAKMAIDFARESEELDYLPVHYWCYARWLESSLDQQHVILSGDTWWHWIEQDLLSHNSLQLRRCLPFCSRFGLLLSSIILFSTRHARTVCDHIRLYSVTNRWRRGNQENRWLN